MSNPITDFLKFRNLLTRTPPCRTRPATTASHCLPVAFRRRQKRFSPSQTPYSRRRCRHQRVGHGIVGNREGDYGPISSLAGSSGIDSGVIEFRFFQRIASARRRRFASAAAASSNQQITDRVLLFRHLKHESKSVHRKRSRPSIPTRPAAL